MKRSLITLIVCMACTMLAHAVTFTVTVPGGTRACYIAGDFNGWDAGNAIEMTPIGMDIFTLTLNDVTEADVAKGYKYLCGQDWAYVEKGPSGEELSNRTAISEMDVVASWAKWHNPDIIEKKMVVNGYTRIVKVFLPLGYETSYVSYPVVYLTGVQARYDNAGSDSDRGDDHMGDVSWNIPGISYDASGLPFIFVSMYGFVAENTPYPYADFAGSGDADAFLNSFETELMPYINSTYRTMTGAENTTIAGGGLGGLFSVYAALKRPDLFGQCAAFSPTIWLNKDDILAYAASAPASEGQRFIVTVGGNEPDYMKNDVDALQSALTARTNTSVQYVTVEGAAHNDVAWGKAFENVFPLLLGADAPVKSNKIVLGASELANTPYSFHSAVDSENLVYDSNVTFNYVDNFVASSGEVEAKVAIVEIPASIKSKYYWNVTRSADGSGDYLKSENGNIGFKSSKSTISWLRVAIFADETVKDIAANSAAFRVVTADSEVTMTPGDNYTATATVDFGSDKSFDIYFGSVNSGSKQSALTYGLNVPADCTKAEIVYNFVTNKATVTDLSGSGDDGGDDDPIDISKTSYSIVSAIDSDNLTYDADSKFSYITNYISGGKEVAAQVVITEIPASVKTQYNWNVSRSADGTGELLKSANGNIGFSSKKTTTSWHRVAVFEDESVVDVAANSAAFRLATASESITMTVVENYKVTASATFVGNDKSFSIHFGSVNSGSDMGTIKDTEYKVSDDCTAADITYDFFTNSVTITETAWGESISDVVIEKFMAVPSFCNPGTTSTLKLALNNADGCEVSVDVAHNYGAETTQTLTRSDNGEWQLTLPNLQAGIYHISLNLTRGATVMKDVETIAIKVVDSDPKDRSILSPYNGIDWSSINQYKANFHTHTTQSFDAQNRVDVTVDKYRNAGYKILALTDHDANPYPWEMFNLFNPSAASRNPAELDMLAIPGNELSKSYTNSWNEVGGSEFNHHNDFFTGRQGMEFGTLQESYAYTKKLGGMQLINHPGQYWSLDKSYTPGEKNSPEWHAQNFMTYSSLIGLEVYNQGNRRPNDRILWDQILDITTEKFCYVWGYSCDDSHNDDQLFRNYNFMLMPSLTIDNLKDAMRDGVHYFCYEYNGSGEAKAPRISNIVVSEDLQTITIETDATQVYWISGTDIKPGSSPSTCKSTVLAVGKTFDAHNFQGNYIRALLVNEYGETCTQPFGFDIIPGSVEGNRADAASAVKVYPNPATDYVTVEAGAEIETVMIYNVVGQCVKVVDGANSKKLSIDVSTLAQGHYVVAVSTSTASHRERLIVK